MQTKVSLKYCMTGCGYVSVSASASLVDISVGITPPVKLKVCAITAGSKRYKSIIKKLWETL